MKESAGGIGLFMIVVLMILLFAGIMSLTVNRSNSFAIKDEIVSIIEDNGYFNMKATWNDETAIGDETLGKIVETIYGHHFRQEGPCPSLCSKIDDESACADAVACYSRSGERVDEGENATIVVLRYKGKNISNYEGSGSTNPTYYKVVVFYRLDLPIVNNILIFHVTGQTKPLYRNVG